MGLSTRTKALLKRRLSERENVYFQGPVSLPAPPVGGDSHAGSEQSYPLRPQRLLSNPAASTSTSTMTLSQRLLRTSALSAPARRVSDTLALPSTALSLNSCSREVTSPVATALVASPSTVRSSPESTPSQDFSPWPTPDQTPTAPSSSLPPLSPAGSMASTLSSVRSLMSNPWLSSRLSRLPDPAAERSTTT